jgi:hypothetical protein
MGSWKIHTLIWITAVTVLIGLLLWYWNRREPSKFIPSAFTATGARRLPVETTPKGVGLIMNGDEVLALPPVINPLTEQVETFAQNPTVERKSVTAIPSVKKEISGDKKWVKITRGNVSVWERGPG